MDSLRWFRIVALLEGLSFILLLFVAMPLKYWMGMPLAVRIVGSLHGALFLAFVGLLGHVGPKRSWSMKKMSLAFLASLVPFGTFVLDRSLKREELTAP